MFVAPTKTGERMSAAGRRSIGRLERGGWCTSFWFWLEGDGQLLVNGLEGWTRGARLTKGVKRA